VHGTMCNGKCSAVSCDGENYDERTRYLLLDRDGEIHGSFMARASHSFEAFRGL